LSRLIAVLPVNFRDRLAALPVESRELERFFKFAVVGTIGAVIDFTVLNVMHKGFGWSLLAANTLSFTCAVLSNFTWNRLWTFPESRSRPIRTQLPQFAAVNIAGLVINNIVLINAAAFLGRYLPDPLDYNLAKAFAIVVVLFWNFGVNRVTTYRGL
jgi:putative flippase GtrA